MHTNFIEVPMRTAFYRVSADTGFGVNAPVHEVQEFALRFAAKWRERVTPQEFLDLLELARQNRDLARDLRACRIRLDTVLRSTAWRITAPIRQFFTWMSD
ncbi:hypothetical protein CCP4SC76_3220003 [Gammaproteobacteria bacterium]